MQRVWFFDPVFTVGEAASLSSSLGTSTRRFQTMIDRGFLSSVGDGGRRKISFVGIIKTQMADVLANVQGVSISVAEKVGDACVDHFLQRFDDEGEFWEKGEDQYSPRWLIYAVGGVKGDTIYHKIISPSDMAECLLEHGEPFAATFPQDANGQSGSETSAINPGCLRVDALYYITLKLGIPKLKAKMVDKDEGDAKLSSRLRLSSDQKSRLAALAKK